MIKNTLFIALTMFSFAVVSCKRDDYLTGGSKHATKYNVTTYDFLKGQSGGLFDTLILLIDKAGLKDKINQQGVTFFAPTDYSIANYLNRRAAEEQNIDPFRKWTIDSLIKYELPKFADSISAYLIAKPLSYDKLSENGEVYATQKAGAQAVVSYEELDPNSSEYVLLGGNYNVSSNPKLIYYTFLYGPLAPPIIAKNIKPSEGDRERIQTSGIETNTGIIHVINNQHILFFRH
jgi:hypothetical protein